MPGFSTYTLVPNRSAREIFPQCGDPTNPADVPAGAALTAAPSAIAGPTENAAGALCYLKGIVTFQSILFSLLWVVGWSLIVAAGTILPFELSVRAGLIGVLLCGGGLSIWLLLMWGGMARQQVGK